MEPLEIAQLAAPIQERSSFNLMFCPGEIREHSMMMMAMMIMKVMMMGKIRDSLQYAIILPTLYRKKDQIEKNG